MMTPGQKLAVGAGAAVVATIAIIGIAEHYAHASEPPKPPPPPPPPEKKCLDGTDPPCCPDGSTHAPGGDPANCGPPHFTGRQGPLAPPNGWKYDGKPTSDDKELWASAIALASVDPCLKSSEPIVRRFQRAVGMLQLNNTCMAESGDGTDGRYGHDASMALSYVLEDARINGQIANVPSAPPTCYPDVNHRPSWWGAHGHCSN